MLPQFLHATAVGESLWAFAVNVNTLGGMAQVEQPLLLLV